MLLRAPEAIMPTPLSYLHRYCDTILNKNPDLSHLKGLPLVEADPMRPSLIDKITIVADLYGFLIFEGVYKGSAKVPIASLIFRWIIAGPISNCPINPEIWTRNTYLYPPA